MSLWDDVFTIEITVVENVFQNREVSFVETFEGSLKGAIRYVLNSNYKGNVTALFYNSKGEYIKELGW